MHSPANHHAEIFPATHSDIPALADLLAVLFAQESEFTPDRAVQIRGLARIIDNPDIGEVFLCKLDGKPVAMLNLLYTVSTALGETVALLEDMVVDPACRGGRIGARLLTHAIEHARQKGCRRITLLTDADNAAAQRFYTRQGFARSGMVAMRLHLA